MVEINQEEEEGFEFSLGNEWQENPNDKRFDEADLAALEQFSKELSTRPVGKQSSLKMAQDQIPSVANNPIFRLLFLRAESYDVKLAVTRFLNYWDGRLQLFGPVKAFLPLTQDGAMRDDIETLRCGYLQAFERNDRVLFFDSDGLPDKYDASSVVRSVAYMMETALLRSERMQKEGFINIIDLGAANALRFDRALVTMMASFVNQGMPIQDAMTLIIRPPSWTSFAVEAIKLFMKAEKRNKIKVISGDDELRALTGLTVGDVLMNDHSLWLLEAREIERRSQCVIVKDGHFDVDNNEIEVAYIADLP